MVGFRIGVIGAGIVGASSALLLQSAGHRVTIFDARGICGGTSFGNAGGVHIGAIQPMATPDILFTAIKLLADPIGPLMLDWRYLPRALPWLARFVWAGRAPSMHATAAAIAALNHRAVDAWREIARAARIEDRLHACGWLKVYDREEDFRAGETERRMMESHGFRHEVLDGGALRELEPALGPTLVRGMWQPDSLFVDNPGRAVHAIADTACARGAEFIRDEVRSIRVSGPRCALQTGSGEYEFDRIVLAAGAWSRPLAAQLGLRIPLDTERGYHLMLPHPAMALRRPVLFPRRRFVLCPMQEGLRITACVEIAGLERGPDYRRIEALLPFAATLLPGMDARIQSRWLGFRPTLPDCRPIIDTVADGRVVFAFGHGHLGLTQGPITARLVQALIEGRTPELDLQPFRNRWPAGKASAAA